MKAKLSVTVDASLVTFVDGLPGESRSAKIEEVLSRFKSVVEDQQLRRELAGTAESEDERLEHEAWVRTMEQDQWKRSDEATSGPSRS